MICSDMQTLKSNELVKIKKTSNTKAFKPQYNWLISHYGGEGN